jgi:hypothetical protein
VLNRKRRYSTTPADKWRKPEYEEHVKKYPFGLASLIGGSAAALIGLMLSFGFVVLIWLLAAHGTESTIQVVRASAIAWQATHLVPIWISGIPVGILPWGFLIIPIVIIWKSMQWSLKSALPTEGRQFWLVAIIFSFTYSAISAVISLLCSTDGLSTSFFYGFAHTFLIAIIICSVVLVEYAPSPKELTARLPEDFLIAFKPGLIAFLLTWFLGAVVTTAVLILRFNEVKAVAGLMAPSAIDQAFLTLLSIGYLPTVITWIFAFVFGAAVHLGGAASVSIGIVSPGALPAFPLLSILPSTATPIAKLALLIPIAAGLVIYLLIPREPWRAQHADLAGAIANLIRSREVIRIVYSMAIFTLGTYLVTEFSSGPLGIGFLSFIGPKPLEVIIWSLKTTGLAALITLIVPRLILSLLYVWQHRQPKAAKVDSVE